MVVLGWLLELVSPGSAHGPSLCAEPPQDAA
jgi:hypothetical protein